MPTPFGDSLDLVRNRFQETRKKRLSNNRIQPILRAVVVETNDPLNMHRVKFRCPDIHDEDLSTDMLPWALQMQPLGGTGSGSWNSFAIDDIIFVSWERGHPYAPVIVGAADPTRVRSYVVDSVYTQSPAYQNSDGGIEEPPNPPDYNKDYLPKDGRPLSHGIKTRYGHMLILDDVGFFPNTHDLTATDAGNDVLAGTPFESPEAKPIKNNPDLKNIILQSKYGNRIIISDVGYDWQAEFTGNAEEDFDFEAKRSTYLQKVNHENKPTGKDQRRIELATRYGHKIELRDVGWTKSRPEYTDDSVTLSEGGEDQRWLKLRTKAGMLIECIDVGFDQDDTFVSRNAIDEVDDIDRESEFPSDDKRCIRLATRYGFKLVLDDRGSSKTDADIEETPRGNGFLVKGRRDNRGFGVEFNEKDELNSMKMYSPNSKLIEINDKDGFVLITTDLPHHISRPWAGLGDNEFSTASGMLKKFAQESSFHLLLHEKDKYIRLKSPKQQGIEVRDNEKWVDVRDVDNRGLHLSSNDSRVSLRSKDEKNMSVILDDGTNKILIQNSEEGVIQIYCAGKIEVISEQELNFKSNKISFKAQTEINFEASGTTAQLANGYFGTNGDLRGREVKAKLPGAMAGSGAQTEDPVSSIAANPTPVPITKDDVKPDDAEVGKVDNYQTQEPLTTVVSGTPPPVSHLSLEVEG